MLIEFTEDTVFSFNGPNLSFLGNTDDFKSLGLVVLELTTSAKTLQIIISELPFVKLQGNKRVIFRSKLKAKCLGTVEGDDVVFELDPKYWERLFKFFALMSWDMATYYLNADDSSLLDLDLEQEVNFICSSAYPHLS